MPTKQERAALAKASGIKPDARMTAILDTTHQMAERFKGLDAAGGPSMRGMLAAVPKSDPPIPRPDLWEAGAELETARMETAAVIFADELDRRRAARQDPPPLVLVPPATEAPAKAPKEKAPAARSRAAFRAWTHFHHHNAVPPTAGVSAVMRLVITHAERHDIEGWRTLSEDSSSFRAFITDALEVLKIPPLSP